MSLEHIAASVAHGSAITRHAGSADDANATGRYVVECRAADGTLRWSDVIDNAVLTAGKNFALDSFLAGSSYTAAWYLGLIDAAGYSAINAADTAASHAGWTESTSYGAASRPAVSWAGASSGQKSISPAASFTSSSSQTIKGCFLVNNATKGGTAGVIYSAGLFSAGDKSLQNGDSLSVTYTAGL